METQKKVVTERERKLATSLLKSKENNKKLTELINKNKSEYLKNINILNYKIEALNIKAESLYVKANQLQGNTKITFNLFIRKIKAMLNY